MEKSSHKRIKSIDLLRGVVIVLMALDHVRDYFHYDAYFFDPTDVSKTNLALFFTRFVTHFCAPVFIFLAGTSAFLVGLRKGKKQLSIWLLKRGIWLIIAELTIIKLAWFFKLDYGTNLLQVIWVLGAGMIFLSGLIHLPKKIVFIVSILVIATHNLFDSFLPTSEIASGIWTFLHVFNIVSIGEVQVFVAYPLIPWIFVMPLGYYFGAFYKPSIHQDYRTKKLMQIGIGLIILFFTIRLINVYGDPYLWSTQTTFASSIISFFNITKYPPSLLFLLITLGPALLFLAFAEKYKGKLAGAFTKLGSVPMFFYIIHLFVIHVVAVIAAMLTGFSFNDMVIDLWVTMQPNLKGYGFNLGVIYIIWITIIIVLYPVCSWFSNYKKNNKNKWWLTYL